MLSQNLAELFRRDLPRVNKEIESYSSEEMIWNVVKGTNNSAGNLALHIAGNLRHFFGEVMGKTEYTRDRDFEFNGRVSRQELLTELDAALESVTGTLEDMTDEDFQKTYPLQPFGKEMSTGWFFMHLYSHMHYHLGQINYHRRFLDK